MTHPQGSNPLRRYAEPPVLRTVELRVQELEIKDVAKREADAGNHAGHRTIVVHALGEDA